MSLISYVPSNREFVCTTMTLFCYRSHPSCSTAVPCDPAPRVFFPPLASHLEKCAAAGAAGGLQHRPRRQTVRQLTRTTANSVFAKDIICEYRKKYYDEQEKRRDNTNLCKYELFKIRHVCF